MFTVISFLLAAAFAGVAIFLPFRMPDRARKIAIRVRTALFRHPSHALFAAGEAPESRDLFLARCVAVSAVVVFAVLVLTASGPFRNHPDASVAVFVKAVLSIPLGALAVAAGIAGASYLPVLRARDTLSRFGMQALWVHDPRAPSQKLRQAIAAQVRESSRVMIIDATGHELLGKGPGATGGIIHDTIASMSGVPVQVLLLQPEAVTPDPETRRATVYQSVLADMDVTPQNFVRRVRTTIQAIDALNEKRPPETRIEVRFYTEKPTCKAVILDNTMFVGPWVGRETLSPSPLLEVSRASTETSLYGTFRFHFSRLWATAVSKQDAAARAGDFRTTVMRKAPAPEQAPAQVPSQGSVAIRRAPAPAQQGSVAIRRAPAPAQQGSVAIRKAPAAAPAQGSVAVRKASQPVLA